MDDLFRALRVKSRLPCCCHDAATCPRLEGLSNPHGASGQMRSLFLALAFVVLSAAATPAKECAVGQYETDKERMIAATKAGTLKADPASGRDGLAPSVFISEAFWYRMTFLEKVDFAELLVCATAGVGRGILVLHLRSDMTGEVIGEWRINQLTVPSTTPRPSVEGGDTPKQTGFSCDPNEKVCRCDGGPEAADCIAMKKNCSGDLQCIVSGGVSSCACRMEITPQEGTSEIKPPKQTTTPPKGSPAPPSPQEGTSVIKPPKQTTTPPKGAPAPPSSGATGSF